MSKTTIEFFDLLLAALLVGAMFGVWLFLSPTGRSATDYAILQQQGIRGLDRVMPLLGAVTIVLTVAAASIVRDDTVRFAMLVAAAMCLVAAGLVTRFLNQPINVIVMTWSADAPPVNWMELRDAWWRWHELRLAIGVIGLSLIIVATLRRTALG